MIRHDVQDDVKQAYLALNMARANSNNSTVIGYIDKAQDKVYLIADKLGVDLLDKI